MNKRLFYISALSLLLISSFSAGSSDATQLRRDKPVRLELPAYSADEQVIEHVGYTTSYNSTTLNPDWVAYELTSAELQGEFKGKSSFCWDPLVKGRKSWREDYKNDQNWDKGHMAPKADMKWSVQAYEESFYLSNVCPQNRTLNGGDWLKTENLARRMAEKYGKVYIVCGPVFKDRKFGTLGEHKVWIPDGFFKALLVPIGPAYESIAFYMDNEPNKNTLRTYAYSVDTIEKMISRDLFPGMNDTMEAIVESHFKLKFWGL
ncbi:MAG: DNA/RNA non-specific endonuclease [Bacteroidales bacterium]|nr:DNA/RNA non-specific endonuclease [Bacteroidales bacterium]